MPRFLGLQWSLPSPSTLQQYAPTYQYETLDKKTRAVRICHLSPAADLSAPLQCSLRNVAIDETGAFTALSYVWGKDPATESIDIDGVTHAIRPNLAAALRQLRSDFKQQQPIPIWADAICINQNSIAERNHQVPLMRLIFSRCKYVFAWLGEADETSNLAMKCIANITNIVLPERESPNLEDSRTKLGLVLTQEHSILSTLGPESFLQSSDACVAIARLLRREFWFRVWIYQELILPENLVIACGSISIPWHKFLSLSRIQRSLASDNKFHACVDHRLSRRIKRRRRMLDSSVQSEIKTLCDIIHPVFEHRVNHLAGQPVTIQELLVDTIHLKSTDPKDKIYGLLGLDQSTGLSPDYGQSVGQIYTEFAKFMLTENLACLRFSGVSTRVSRSEGSIPSWVPAWDALSRATKTTLQWKVSSDVSRHLHIKWANVDFVEKTSLPTILNIYGQLGSKIAWIKTHSQWRTETWGVSSIVTKMERGEYPHNINASAGPFSDKIIALYCTLLIEVPTYLAPGRWRSGDLERAAGFCASILSDPRLSHPIYDYLIDDLFIRFCIFWRGPEYTARDIESWLEIYQHRDRYKADFLLLEKENFENRVLFETDDGHLGMAPTGTREGDILCSIYNFSDPVLLRPVGGYYVLVGVCWALGYMDFWDAPRTGSTLLEII